jgi:hypothetical protein
MTEKTFEGKTRAEWLSFQGKGGKLGCPTEVDIHRAMLWFQAEDKKAQIEIEERRFQTQLDEAKRQGLLTRRVAWLALVVSAGALAVSMLKHDTPTLPQSVPTPQQMPPSASQRTNAVPATAPKP